MVASNSTIRLRSPLIFTVQPSFFSDLSTEWWDQPVYTQIVQEIRETGHVGKLRPIVIVTSGPISISSISTFELELEMATDISGIELSLGLLSWHALNHELDYRTLSGITQRLRTFGVDFIPIGTAHVGEDRTSKMYDAREVVQEHVLSLPGDPIICWLDSDLEFSALVADEDDLRISHPWPWIHMVWHQWLSGKEVDIAIGDVTGDPPIPASSTILTNLRDLALNGEEINGSRWLIRDPAYDFSEIAKPEVRFPRCVGAWSDHDDILNTMLWKGTLNRPLVTSKEILTLPHRPWFVRGGVTVVFNREAMRTPTPRFHSSGMIARRGDSFWLVRNALNQEFTIGQFPFPLLHRRGNPNLGRDDLICSFQSRFFGDLLGAASLKGTMCALEGGEGVLERHIHAAIESRAARSQEVLEMAVSQVKNLNGAISTNESSLIRRALSIILSDLDRMDFKQAASDLSQQISDYLGVIVDE